MDSGRNSSQQSGSKSVNICLLGDEENNGTSVTVSVKSREKLIGLSKNRGDNKFKIFQKCTTFKVHMFVKYEN